MQENSSFFRRKEGRVPLPNLWASPIESLVQTSSGRKLQSKREGKADMGWKRQPLERERSASSILISWELLALKAQVSHRIPAMKTNSPFYLNLNQKTGAYKKTKITQLLHSKRISFQAGPHLKHYRGGPFIYGKKTIERHWCCTDKWTNCSHFLEAIP